MPWAVGLYFRQALPVVELHCNSFHIENTVCLVFSFLFLVWCFKNVIFLPWKIKKLQKPNTNKSPNDHCCFDKKYYQQKRMIIYHSAILESSVKKEINYFNGIISQLQHFPWGFLIYLTCSTIPSFSVMTFCRKIKMFKEH